MVCREFGADRHETVVLLHGGGLSWWNYRAEAELLQSEYHVVLPVLDGHAGSDRPFTSIEDNAAELIAWIDGNCGGSVLLIGGLSLGAQIALEALSQRSGVCRCALVESASVIPSRLTGALIGPALGSSYGLIKSRRFAKMQFKSLRINGSLFEDYFRDTREIAKADMTAFLKASASYSLKDPIAATTARVHVLAGERERRGMLRSAEMIKRRVPDCTARILPGLYHGGFSLNHPDRYVGYLKSVVGNK